MSKAAAARKLASAAAYGGGGVSALGAAIYGLLRLEATIARRTIGDTRDGAAAGRDRLVRPRPTRPGDQGRAARRLERRGVRRRTGSRRRPGAVLASGARRARGPPGAPALVRRRRRPVRPTSPPRSTGRCRPSPDVAVILIGVNDVTHRVLPGAVGAPPRRGRAPAARGRRRGGRRHLPRPRHGRADRAAAAAGRPRLVAPARRPRRRSRSSRRAAAPCRSARSSARSSRPRPALLFGPDRFHPSADGYRSLAQVLLPSTLAALGLIPSDEAEPEAYRGEGVLPVADRGRPGRRPRPAPSSTAPRSAAPRRGVRGLLGGAAAPPPRSHGHRRGEAPRRGRRRGAAPGDVAGVGQSPTPVGGPGPSRPRRARS